MILPASFVPNPALLEAHGLFTYVATVGDKEVFRVRA